MLDVLHEVLERLPKLLREPGWESLDIDYHPPRVERVWRQDGSNRILLHLIHGCWPSEALMHPHPWPSAVLVLEGEYVMMVAQGPTEPPAPSAIILMVAGSTYAMTDPWGWHSVAPVGLSLSVMVVGPPYGQRTRVGNRSRHRLAQPPVTKELKLLPPDRVEDILAQFRTHFPGDST